MDANGDPRGSLLVVDDEPTITEVLSRYLERAGYETRVAADGPHALELAGDRRPDLVILDLMLPGLDGLEVMRRLRALDEGSLRPRMPIILLTARGEETDRVAGLRLGADDYVVKPFSPSELVARVDAEGHRPLLRREVGEALRTAFALDPDTGDIGRLHEWRVPGGAPGIPESRPARALPPFR